MQQLEFNFDDTPLKLGKSDIVSYEVVTAMRGRVAFNCQIKTNSEMCMLQAQILDHIRDLWIEFNETEITLTQWQQIKENAEYYAQNLINGGKK